MGIDPCLEISLSDFHPLIQADLHPLILVYIYLYGHLQVVRYFCVTALVCLGFLYYEITRHERTGHL